MYGIYGYIYHFLYTTYFFGDFSAGVGRNALSVLLFICYICYIESFF